MARSTVARLIEEVPVQGTEFACKIGQDVYVVVDGKDDIFEGKVLARGTIGDTTENMYRVRLKSGVHCLYIESQLIGRRWFLFDSRGNTVEGKVFYSLQEAIDGEEDLGYDSLTAQYEAANGTPDNLVAESVEIWEVNETGVRIGERVQPD